MDEALDASVYGHRGDAPGAILGAIELLRGVERKDDDAGNFLAHAPRCGRFDVFVVA